LLVIINIANQILRNKRMFPYSRFNIYSSSDAYFLTYRTASHTISEYQQCASHSDIITKVVDPCRLILFGTLSSWRYETK